MNETGTRSFTAADASMRLAKLTKLDWKSGTETLNKEASSVDDYKRRSSYVRYIDNTPSHNLSEHLEHMNICNRPARAPFSP